MKKLQQDITNVARSLAALSRQVERIAGRVEKLQAGKPATTRKTTKTVRKTVKTVPVLDTVYKAVRRSRNGLTISALKNKTGFDSRQLSNALYKLSKRDKIYAKSRGHYIKK